MKALISWIIGWWLSYIFMGFFLVNKDYIAFVWPVYELYVSVLHIKPANFGVQISIILFFGLIWAPLPFGIIKRRVELIAIPFGVLFGTWLSGIIWGHAYAT